MLITIIMQWPLSLCGAGAACAQWKIWGKKEKLIGLCVFSCYRFYSVELDVTLTFSNSHEDHACIIYYIDFFVSAGLISEAYMLWL